MTYSQLPPIAVPAAPTVCAVIVCFEPNDNIFDILEYVNNETHHIVLVENGTDIPSPPLTSACMTAFDESLTLLTCTENNLAKAQNLGIREAQRQGYGWVLLLDDDSRPQPGMVANMLAAWQALPGEERALTALLAPNIQDERLNHPDHFVKLWKNLFFYKEGLGISPLLRDILYVPASGSLMPATLFAHTGYMEERFSIYFVDTEFCLRLRRLGYGIIAVRDARMRHRIGHRSEHRLLGLRVTTTNHPPRARRLMYRNRLKLLHRYGLRFPGYALFDILRMGYEILRVLCFENDKKEKLRAMWQGAKEAVCGSHCNASET